MPLSASHFIPLLLLLQLAEALQFGLSAAGFHWADSLQKQLSDVRLATQIHHSEAGGLLLVAAGESTLRRVPSAPPVQLPRGSLLGIADGPSFLSLAGQKFLVTRASGQEQALDGVQQLLAGAFACTAESCYAIASNGTHRALVSTASSAQPRWTELALLDLGTDSAGGLVVLAHSAGQLALYNASLVPFVGATTGAGQLFGRGLLLSKGTLVPANDDASSLALLLEQWSNASALPRTSPGAASAVSRTAILKTGLYVINSATPQPDSIVLVQSQSELSFQPGAPVPAFNELHISGGTLYVDLSEAGELADGDTLLLFTFSSLQGDFDRIVIESSSSACERMAVANVDKNNGHYSVQLIRTSTCARAARCFLLTFLCL